MKHGVVHSLAISLSFLSVGLVLPAPLPLVDFFYRMCLGRIKPPHSQYCVKGIGCMMFEGPRSEGEKGTCPHSFDIFLSSGGLQSRLEYKPGQEAMHLLLFCGTRHRVEIAWTLWKWGGKHWCCKWGSSSCALVSRRGMCCPSHSLRSHPPSSKGGPHLQISRCVPAILVFCFGGQEYRGPQTFPPLEVRCDGPRFGERGIYACMVVVLL